MRTDLYTKLVLTVIAFCLVWICFRDVNLSTPVEAQPRPQEVVISGVRTRSGFLPVSIRQSEQLPVTISSVSPQLTQLPVSINGVNLQNQQLPVSIENIGRGLGQNGEAVPVRAVRTP
jgi:hypothetical protein